jgi:tetratricopeptide (TPR) repeat protein
MSKKLSKEDLEQDLLIEYSSRFIHFYSQNKATVLGGGLGIILLIGLIIGYVIYSGQQESRAQVLLGIAERSLAQGDFETALYGDDGDLTLGFVQISNNYSRTDAGNLAKYYAAVSEYELGNYESALRFIKEFNIPRGILGVSPISLHAIILAELERYDEAARKFEEAARWDKNEATTPYNLFEAAQAHLEADNPQEAKRLIEKILKDYPTSQVASRAQRLRGQISARS